MALSGRLQASIPPAAVQYSYYNSLRWKIYTHTLHSLQSFLLKVSRHTNTMVVVDAARLSSSLSHSEWRYLHYISTISCIFSFFFLFVFFFFARYKGSYYWMYSYYPSSATDSARSPRPYSLFMFWRRRSSICCWRSDSFLETKQ